MYPNLDEHDGASTHVSTESWETIPSSTTASTASTTAYFSTTDNAAASSSGKKLN